jgi:anti-anti-sigma regulatory factor
MLRVTPSGDQEAHCLHVEGRLAGPAELEVLRKALVEAESSGRRVVLELSGLRFADEHAILLLAGLAARGVELVGSSPWLASLLGGAR